MVFSMLTACSGVYIRVPYSTDTPVPWFDLFLELTTTVYLGYVTSIEEDNYIEEANNCDEVHVVAGGIINYVAN